MLNCSLSIKTSKIGISFCHPHRPRCSPVNWNYRSHSYNDLSIKTLFILYFKILMPDNFIVKKLLCEIVSRFVKNFKLWMRNFWVKSNAACNLFSLFIFFLVRQLEEHRADEYINIMTGNWWPETD